MIVCHCRGITDRDVRSAVDRGATDLAALARECGAGTDCRNCRPTLEALLPVRKAFAVIRPASRDRAERSACGARAERTECAATGR